MRHFWLRSSLLRSDNSRLSNPSLAFTLSLASLWGKRILKDPLTCLLSHFHQNNARDSAHAPVFASLVNILQVQ